MGGIPKTQVLMLTFLMHYEESEKSTMAADTSRQTSELMSLTWICTNYLQLLCNHFTEKL